jgi:hypothetical protein
MTCHSIRLLRFFSASSSSRSRTTTGRFQFSTEKAPILTRVPNPETTIGMKASPSLFAVMFSAPEGQARTVSLEGVPLLTAFVRSGLTGPRFRDPHGNDDCPR